MTAAVAPSRATALRSLLVERFPNAVLLPERSAPPLATGVLPLDRILPNGGLPRGRMVVWQSKTGGATAILRAACQGIANRGERVAWIDGARTIGPGWIEGPLVVRPENQTLALRATEILLRSGGLALVILTGIDPDQSAMLRLSRMVHEGQGAFIALTDRGLTASIRLSSRFLVDRFRWSTGPFGEVAAVDSVTVEITVKASGWSERTTFSLPAKTHDLRVSLEPGLADRRGALD